jgi:hypothetical protein
LVTIFTITLLATITTSAQFAAPNYFKPTTFLCQKFDTCELSTGCPKDSKIYKPNQTDVKYIWPTTGCISRCVVDSHIACDIVNTSMPPVFTIADGRVTQVNENNGDGYGNTIVVDHGNGITSLYAHLSEMYVSKGQTIKQSEKIGRIGNTGNSNEPHLHIEIKQNGINQNPLDFFAK